MGLRVVLDAGRGRGAASRRAARTPSSATTTPTAHLSDEQKTALRAEGRHPVLRLRMPDRATGVGRPGARRGVVRGRARARLRHRARQRRAALHPGEPGRRRTHGHHARAARRGPALVHPAPARDVRGAGRDRGRRRYDAALRAPALRHGGGQQEALQARPAELAQPLSRGGLPARGSAQLPGPAGLVARRRPRVLLAVGAGGAVRHLARAAEPGAVRLEEVSRHQRRLDPARERRRSRRPARALPRRGAGHRRLRRPRRSAR